MLRLVPNPMPSPFDARGTALPCAEACQLAISLRPDLVLTELSMPGMGAIEGGRLVGDL